jgi:hypothetical protein
MDRLVTQCRPKNRIDMHWKSKDTENQILPYNFTNADNYSLQLLEEKNARSTQTLTDAKLHQIHPLKHTHTHTNTCKKWEEIKIKKIRKRSIVWLSVLKKRACCQSLPQRNSKLQRTATTSKIRTATTSYLTTLQHNQTKGKFEKSERTTTQKQQQHHGLLLQTENGLEARVL